MKDLDILREQVNSLTERLRNISNSLSNGNLDSVSKLAYPINTKILGKKDKHFAIELWIWKITNSQVKRQVQQSHNQGLKNQYWKQYTRDAVKTTANRNRLCLLIGPLKFQSIV